MKPVIIYVDDEPNNLTVFEAAMPDEFDVKIFDSPVTALGKLDELKPWVVVSDQRMPTMKGVEFLELVRKLAPHAVRLIVTGYSEEDLIIESVRKAQVFDYIRKPWDVSDLVASLKRAVSFSQINTERERLVTELTAQRLELEIKTENLLKVKTELELAAHREKAMVQELACWVPPYVLWSLNHPEVKFPLQKKLVGITFDIVGSGRIHGLKVRGRPARARVIELFSEAILRNGGWRESHSGDSAYAHFGLEADELNPFDAALASAREFRVALRSLGQVQGIDIECGISLHVIHDAMVDVHKIQLSTPKGVVTQKSFDTASSDIDLLHRIEKLVHDLPGSNIIMTQDFMQGLSQPLTKSVSIGSFSLRGQPQPAELHVLPGDLVLEEHWQAFHAKHQTRKAEPVAA